MHHQLLAQATRLLEAGLIAPAIEAHEQLLQLNPHLPDSWYNLGYLQQRAGLYAQALASYEQALKRGLEDPEEAQLNRAVLLIEKLARPDEGEKILDELLASAPGYVPALLNLGNLHEQRGSSAQALSCYQKVLALAPGHALALSRMVNLAPVASPADPRVTQLRQALASKGIAAWERADLGFALGKALDQAGAFDDAFAAYQHANLASLRSADDQRLPRYDPQAHERWVNHLIASYPLAPPSAATTQSTTAGATEDGAPSLIFICGMFRSGSSLVEKILSSHPRVSAGGELDWLPHLARQQALALGAGSPPLKAQALSALRARYLENARQQFPAAHTLTDKRVDNFLHIGLIQAVFPTAKIIHTCRHPIDNCLSIYFLHLSQAMPYASQLPHIGHWYRQYARLMAHWEQMHAAPQGNPILSISYDQLVTAPERVIAELLNHCGLPWDDACLHFHQTEGVVATPSAWQVRQPIYTRSSGRWKHYQRHLAPLLEALDWSG